MHIKDIQKTTLIDYPGLIAATVFVGGCNFKCAYCYNQALLDITSKPDISQNDILKILDQRKKYIDGVVITGGEPTIQSGLMDFINQIHQMGLKIKLDTNGYRPDVLGELIQHRAVHYIALDIKAPLKKYSLVTGIEINPNLILESIAHLQSSSIPHEYRSTVWQEDFLLEDLLGMVDLIKADIGTPYYLQNFYQTDPQNHTSFTPFSKKQILSFLEKAQEVFPSIQLRGEWV